LTLFGENTISIDILVAWPWDNYRDSYFMSLFCSTTFDTDSSSSKVRPWFFFSPPKFYPINRRESKSAEKGLFSVGEKSLGLPDFSWYSIPNIKIDTKRSTKCAK
jgi:hypothetical protein